MFNTVLELLKSRNYKAIREIFMDMNEADVAALLQQFYDDHEVEKYELPLLFRLLNKDVAADVFAYMDSDTQMMLINAFTDKELQEIVDDLYLDDTVDIIEEMPANVVARIIKSADAETRKQINQILKYPKDSAGSIMTTEYVYLHRSYTAKEALDDYYNVVTANSCKMALRYLEKHTPDIILLDIQMPEVDGFETLKAIRSLPQTEDTPIIFLTAQDNVADEIHGLELGAVDYIHKPLQPQIMRMRIRTQLDLAHYQDHLEEIIMQKTEQVARVETALLASLNDLLEIRDGMTGSHVRRTAKYFEILLNALDKAHTFPDAITPDYKVRLLRGAPLHDLGKVGISDNTLLKPSRLSPEEMEFMRQHSTFGGQALTHAVEIVGEDSFLSDARDMAYYHHEKWDGSGYPKGLAGEDIPLSARILAVADVYDALTSQRSYKDAFSHEKAVSILLDEDGTSFDPRIMQVFRQITDEFAQAKASFSSEAKA